MTAPVTRINAATSIVLAIERAYMENNVKETDRLIREMRTMGFCDEMVRATDAGRLLQAINRSSDYVAIRDLVCICSHALSLRVISHNIAGVGSPRGHEEVCEGPAGQTQSRTEVRQPWNNAQ